MADLAIQWKDGKGDLVIINDELLLDDSLTTAIVISLFTDKRVNDDRGWWGDSFNEDKNFRTGSKLWTLYREKQLQFILDDVQHYAEEALKWLIDDDIVKYYQVLATNPKTSVLLLTIIVTLFDGSVEQMKFSANWSI